MTTTDQPGFDLDEPAVKEARTARRRWRIGLAVGTAVVVVGAFAGYAFVSAHKSTKAANSRADALRKLRATYCDGLDAATGPGFGLTRWPVGTGHECVGWDVDQDVTFGATEPATAAVIHDILVENRRVRDQAKQYARIAVFMPMTGTSTSALSPAEVRVSLEGVYAAQKYANRAGGTELGDPMPQVQLVLANEATDEGAWSPVVDRLGALTTGTHPLVAVTGMGISIPTTQLAAARFGKLGIPTIGAVVTADDMVAPSFFKVSPSNHQYAAALLKAIEGQQSVHTAYLAYDRSASDNYVKLLKKAFTDTFNGTYDIDEHSGGFNGSKPPTLGTPQLFDSIVRDVCALDPDVVFFTGRDRDLAPLVEALGNRGRCTKNVRPLVVATGATGLTITAAQADAANVGILDASSTDPAGWAAGVAGTPQYYAPFSQRFTGELHFPATDLTDGYAVMHYDAVAAAVRAVRSRASDSTDGAGSAPPTPSDVRDALFSLASQTIPLASGDIYFHELPANDLWPSHKPVPLILTGQVMAHWKPTELYLTPDPGVR